MLRPKHVLYCSACGFIDIRNQNRICPFCKRRLQESDRTFIDKSIWYSNELEEIENDIFQRFIKNNDNFDNTKCKHRLQQIEVEKQYAQARQDQTTTNAKPQTYEEWQEQIQIEARKAADKRAKAANAPRCPTCGSTDLKKIDALDRAISVSFLGLASGKIGKSFKCNHCGYMW